MGAHTKQYGKWIEPLSLTVIEPKDRYIEEYIDDRGFISSKNLQWKHISKSI